MGFSWLWLKFWSNSCQLYAIFALKIHLKKLLFKHFKTKNTGIKTGYVEYHDPDFFFVINLAYVNMFIVNKEIFYLVPQFIYQGILKNIYLNHAS